MEQQTINKTRTIALVAGRSGGHIIPGITLAEQFKKNNAADAIHFFCSAKPLDKKILDAAQGAQGIDAITIIPLQQFPGKKIWRLPSWIVNFLYCCWISFSTLRSARPEKLVSMGSDVSIPVCIAAVLLRIPIELFELNAVPGKAIKILAPLATKIFVTFAECQQHFSQYKIMLAPYPIRYKRRDYDLGALRAQLGFDADKKIIFILGGSQGSVSVNQHIKKMITDHPEVATQFAFIHQTGAQDKTDWQQWYRNHGVTAHSFAFSNDIEHFYAQADLIICRAGAGTLFEIAFFAKPCIIIPLEADSTLHQLDNANAFARQYHAATVLQEKTLQSDPAALYKNIISKLE